MTLRPPTKSQNATSSCTSGASSPQPPPSSPSRCHRLLQPLTARALRQSTRCSPASRKSPLPPTLCLAVCLKSPAPISFRTQVRHTSFIPTDSPAGWRLPSCPPPPPARPSARLLHGSVDLAYQPRYAPMVAHLSTVTISTRFWIVGVSHTHPHRPTTRHQMAMLKRM